MRASHDYSAGFAAAAAEQRPARTRAEANGSRENGSSPSAPSTPPLVSLLVLCHKVTFSDCLSQFVDVSHASFMADKGMLRAVHLLGSCCQDWHCICTQESKHGGPESHAVDVTPSTAGTPGDRLPERAAASGARSGNSREQRSSTPQRASAAALRVCPPCISRAWSLCSCCQSPLPYDIGQECNLSISYLSWRQYASSHLVSSV